jgi:hypothetical protein
VNPHKGLTVLGFGTIAHCTESGTVRWRKITSAVV